MTERRLSILALNWRCLEHPQAGGCELNLFEQARRWARNGHDVTVFTARSGDRVTLPRTGIYKGVRIHRRGGRFTVYLFAALYLLRHASRYDAILDVTNGIPFFAPLFARRPTTLLVHHIHGEQWFTEFPGPIAAIGRFIEERVVPVVYRRARVIAVSPSTRDGLVAMGFDSRSIELVYNGVSVSEEGSGASVPDATRVVYVGRIKSYKRLDRLVRAAAALRSEFPNLIVDIAGSGDALPALAALVASLDVGGVVRLHGHIDERKKATLLRSATLFATPSMHEGWGLSVIEANYFGCPAVAYDVPGLNVSILHGETGWLATDDIDFQESIARVLRDPVLRARLSEGARAWARRFSWDEAAERTLEVMTPAHRRAACS